MESIKMPMPANENDATRPEHNTLAPFCNTPKHEVPARYRRIQATSFDTSEAGTFGISSIRHKVAAPPSLKEPLEVNHHDKVSQTVSYAIGSKIIRKALKIAREEGVKLPDLDEDEIHEAYGLYSVTFPRISMAGHPTIFITAQWESDDLTPLCWERAVRRIKKSVDHERMLRSDVSQIDVSVQIIAEETLKKIRVKLLTTEDLQSIRISEQAWTSIKRHVRATFVKHEGTSHITSISLVRRGRTDQRELPVTVYITVDYESNEITWPLIINDIQLFLRNHHDQGLAVHVEYNEFDGSCYLVPDQNYTSPANLGHDIGAGQYIPGLQFGKYNPDIYSWMTEEERQWNIEAFHPGVRQPLPTLPSHPPPMTNTGPQYGTLGCWLEIKTRSDPTTWTKVALTSYHTMRPTISGFATDSPPPKDSDLAKADSHGIKHHDTPTAMPVSNPCWASHAYWHNKAETLLQRTEDLPETRDERQRKYNQQVEFISQGNHIVGHLWCASGYNRRSPNGGGRLDWALIMPTDQEQAGVNKIPNSTGWSRHGEYYGRSRCLKNPPRDGLRGMEHRTTLFKVNAATGNTGGTLCRAFRSDVRLPKWSGTKTREYTYTEEFVWIGYAKAGGRFVDGGDAGSVVLEEYGRAVGMVSPGGSIRPQNGDYRLNDQLAGLVPIEDVLRDVVAFSDGEVVEVRIAESEIEDEEAVAWGVGLKKAEEEVKTVTNGDEEDEDEQVNGMWEFPEYEY